MLLSYFSYHLTVLLSIGEALMYDQNLYSIIRNNQNFAVSDVNDELRQLCRDFDVHIITYSPLGAGFLTGKYRNAVSPDVRFEIIPGHTGDRGRVKTRRKRSWFFDELPFRQIIGMVRNHYCPDKTH